MKRFTNKVVIVTGAGSGIGAATARRFSQEGARVVLADLRRGKIEEIGASLDSDHCLVHEVDVTSKEAMEGMVAACVARFGRLDVMVNNAGIAVFGPFLEASVEDWRRVMAVDIDGVFFGCRAALPQLLKTQGSIVNVSSVSGLGGDWNLSFYNAAKGAVSNLTRALAMEFGEKGVRINAVNPGLTATELSVDIVGNQEIMAKFADRVPIGRAARPEEIAAAIAFLASDDASFVNGVNLPVDGGLSAANGQPRFA